MPRRRASPSVAAAFLLALLHHYAAGQQFDYEPGDWEFIPGTAAITSASEGPDGIYFSTFDGVLYFDHFAQRLDHLPDINMGLPSRRLHQVYYDATTEALWVVHEDGIAFRLPTDETWREVHPQSLPEYFRGVRVTRVGGTFEGVWIDMGGVYTLLHPFTGLYMRGGLDPPDEPVSWSHSRATFLEPPDLLGWVTSGRWSASIHEFLGPGFMTAVPNFVFQDRYGQHWYGTNLGTLFHGDPRTHNLEVLQAGIAPETVTILYRDGDRVWFGDNAFRRQGVLASRRAEYFLSAWDERIDSWRHFSSLASEAIRDVGINDMLRVGRQLWLATMNGIVQLDTRSGTWGFLGLRAGLRDRAIWGLEQHDGEIFAATALGIDRINPATSRVVPEDSSSISPPVEAYCLWSTGRVLYAGTAAGIYAYQKERLSRWWQVSGHPAISLWGDETDLYAVAGNVVYHRGARDAAFNLAPVPLPPEAKILEIKGYESYIWLATSQGAVVYDRRDKRRFIFDTRDGLPSNVIYAIEPGTDWVWFLTGQGVVRFNWRAYLE